MHGLRFSITLMVLLVALPGRANASDNSFLTCVGIPESVGRPTFAPWRGGAQADWMGYLLFRAVEQASPQFSFEKVVRATLGDRTANVGNQFYDVAANAFANRQSSAVLRASSELQHVSDFLGIGNELERAAGCAQSHRPSELASHIAVQRIFARGFSAQPMGQDLERGHPRHLIYTSPGIDVTRAYGPKVLILRDRYNRAFDPNHNPAAPYPVLPGLIYAEEIEGIVYRNEQGRGEISLLRADESHPGVFLVFEFAANQQYFLSRNRRLSTSPPATYSSPYQVRPVSQDPPLVGIVQICGSRQACPPIPREIFERYPVIGDLSAEQLPSALRQEMGAFAWNGKSARYAPMSEFLSRLPHRPRISGLTLHSHQTRNAVAAGTVGRIQQHCDETFLRNRVCEIDQQLLGEPRFEGQLEVRWQCSNQGVDFSRTETYGMPLQQAARIDCSVRWMSSFSLPVSSRLTGAQGVEVLSANIISGSPQTRSNVTAAVQVQAQQLRSDEASGVRNSWNTIWPERPPASESMRLSYTYRCRESGVELRVESPHADSEGLPLLFTCPLDSRINWPPVLSIPFVTGSEIRQADLDSHPTNPAARIEAWYRRIGAASDANELSLRLANLEQEAASPAFQSAIFQRVKARAVELGQVQALLGLLLQEVSPATAMPVLVIQRSAAAALLESLIDLPRLVKLPDAALERITADQYSAWLRALLTPAFLGRLRWDSAWDPSFGEMLDFLENRVDVRVAATVRTALSQRSGALDVLLRAHSTSGLSSESRSALEIAAAQLIAANPMNYTLERESAIVFREQAVTVAMRVAITHRILLGAATAQDFLNAFPVVTSPSFDPAYRRAIAGLARSWRARFQRMSPTPEQQTAFDSIENLSIR